MGQKMDDKSLDYLPPEDTDERENLAELKIFVSEDIARAWQRCSWVIVHETGRKRTDIMSEMVQDFLVKYEC